MIIDIYIYHFYVFKVRKERHYRARLERGEVLLRAGCLVRGEIKLTLHVEKLKGSFNIEYSLCKFQSEKLWNLLKNLVDNADIYYIIKIHNNKNQDCF